MFASAGETDWLLNGSSDEECRWPFCWGDKAAGASGLKLLPLMEKNFVSFFSLVWYCYSMKFYDISNIGMHSYLGGLFGLSRTEKSGSENVYLNIRGKWVILYLTCHWSVCQIPGTKFHKQLTYQKYQIEISIFKLMRMTKKHVSTNNITPGVWLEV